MTDRITSGHFEQLGEKVPVAVVIATQKDDAEGPGWFVTYQLGLGPGEAIWTLGPDRLKVVIDDVYEDRTGPAPPRQTGKFTIAGPAN